MQRRNALDLCSVYQQVLIFNFKLLQLLCHSWFFKSINSDDVGLLLLCRVLLHDDGRLENRLVLYLIKESVCTDRKIHTYFVLYTTHMGMYELKIKLFFISKVLTKPIRQLLRIW